MLARALELALDEGHHHVVIDSVLRTAGEYLDEHREVLRDRLRSESPWWVPEPIDDRIYEKVVGGAKRFLSDLRADPDHELRQGIDERLRGLVDRLRTDPELALRVEERKDALLAQPAVQSWMASLWGELKRSLAVAARDPSSELRQRMEAALASAGRSLRDDPELQADRRPLAGRRGSRGVGAVRRQRRRLHRRHRGALGSAGDLRPAWSCRSGATSSSSASTGPWWAGWPVCSSTCSGSCSEPGPAAADAQLVAPDERLQQVEQAALLGRQQS